MTRESPPSFDLYAELEVSRMASVEVIEAAYRTLAKSHHPDVARPQDSERIKRLNLAREWLADPVRRRRYDTAAPLSAPSGSKAATASKAAPSGVERSPWTSTAKAFGPNTDAVRQFLADLRALDEPRALAIRDGRAAIDPIAYAVARHVAYSEGRNARQDEWLLAHEAASVIARGKLGDSPLAPVVADVVADIAGAITVRDLISRSDLDVLLQPWNRRVDPVAAAPEAGGPVPPIAGPPEGSAPPPEAAPPPPVSPVMAAGSAPSGALSPARNVGPAAAAIAPRERVRLGRRGASMLAAPPAVLATVVLIALASVVLALNGTRPEVAVADRTDPPSATPSLPPNTVAVSPIAAEPAIPSPASTSSFIIVPSDTSVPEPSTVPGPASTPRVTFRPPGTAQPPPVASPAPTPVPSPSPALCTVPSLIDQNTVSAQLLWSEVGFTGIVDFSPSVPPHYKIGWQSLTPSESVLCTSGITVRKDPP